MKCVSVFETAQRLFGDEPLNFDSCSDDKEESKPTLLLQTSVPHQQMDIRPSRSSLTGTRPTYITGLRWNRDSKLKPSGAEVDTLPLSHRIMNKILHLKREFFLQ
ncbi:hypothetical protein AVEN_216765-1 [Araneus ventricosus]|uniref:Uncharacterized protein n=1 Tax=Araneus ventricosus TaxID=182803 RepID=A0A4Y2MMI0_ARAVE|nr:hypothetical protein AVEN_216765-1 [Araneus ventricosus]